MSGNTYTFYAGDEKIDGVSGHNYLANQTGLVEGATVDDLRSYWDDALELQDQFGGDFNNYLAYMDEREALIQSGEYSVGEYGQIVETSAVQNVDGTMIEPSDIQNLSRNDFIAKYGLDPSEVNLTKIDTTNARGVGFNNWAKSDAVVALNEKYGIDQLRTTDKGREYQWNGSAYVKTKDYDNVDFGTIAKGVAGATLAGMTGAGLAPVLGGALGVSSASGIGALKGALGATVGGALNGDIDPKSVAVGALMGGLNPGGMLSDKLKLNPKSFGGGFVAGAANDLVGNTIMTGDVDLKSAGLAGLQAGGINSVMDAVNSINNNTPEAIMDRIANQHRADYVALNGTAVGYEGLTDVQLNQIAMSQPLVNKTTFGSLIGEGGLISAIPAMDISGLATLKDNVFGYTHGTQLFTGPDGETLTNAELIEQGYDPQQVFEGSIHEGTDVDGYKYYGTVDTTNSDSLFNQFTEWAGDTRVGESVSNALDVMSAAQFKSKYGFLPQDNPQLAQQIIAYGDLTENYTYSDNPRGDSEMYGSTFWLPDEYTKGLRTEQTNATVNEDGNWVGGTRSAIQVSQETVDQINEMGEEQREQILNSPYIINYMQQQQEQAQVDPATGNIDKNTVLPGAENNPFLDALIAALQQGGDTSTETGGTSVETGSNSTDKQANDQTTLNNDQVAGNVNGNRTNQITGLLSTAQQSAQNSTQVTGGNNSTQVTGGNNSNRINQVIGLLDTSQQLAQSSNTQQTLTNNNDLNDDRVVRGGDVDTTTQILSGEELPVDPTDELPVDTTDQLPVFPPDELPVLPEKLSDDPPDELPVETTTTTLLPPGGGGGGGGGGLFTLGDNGGDNPYWTPLNPYSNISKWRKARERVYNNIEGLLTPTGKSPEYAMSKKQMTEEGLLS